MSVVPNPPLVFRCGKCGWSRSVKSDAIVVPDCCPKCGSNDIKLERSRNIIDALKRKLGL